MEKVTLSSKVFTENPLLDEIIYNIRQLAIGTILKDQDKADNNETLESIKAGDVLISLNRGHYNFNFFYYDETLLRQISGLTEEEIIEYSADNSKIPESIRKPLFNMASETFLNNYVEYNNYYRMLHGEPDYDETGVWQGLWIDDNYIDEEIPTSLDHISIAYKEEYDNNGNLISDYKLIHELSLAKQIILDSNGTLDNIIENETWLTANNLERDNVLYLFHMGDKQIEYYDARTAEKFAMLYCPSCDSEEVRIRYKDLLEANRLYLLYTVYSTAYKYRSDYYDNFMMVFLIIQTIIDMIVELPEYLIRRDIFDTRTAKYIFESNGVKYFKDIPLRYQIALVKNLNKLIKFKSTDKCIVDIISLFGFRNINAFKYYILKDRNVNNPDNLDYYDNTKIVTDEEGNRDIVPDNDTNYDVKFIKVPLLDPIYDNYAKKDQNILEYDELTLPDAYWTGDKQYETVKSGVKDLDFTVLRSKYYTIEAVIDLAERNFSLVYFMNILMYNKIDKSSLRINLPNISTTKKVELVNAILALYSLGYIYYGVEDTIMDSRSKIAEILGFNMEADFAAIAQYLHDNHRGLTLEELCYGHDAVERPGFTVPSDDKIYSFEELRAIFLNNRDIYKHVIEVMQNPPSKEIYNAYRYLYKTLFIMDMNLEYFLVGDNDIVDEYKSNGYTTRFINIPKPENYQNPDVYEYDMKCLTSTCNENTLYFEMSDNFNDTHEFNLYTYNPENEEFISLNATAKMASTYTEYMRYNDGNIYKFLVQVASIDDEEKRQETCVNAIQQIIGYIKDYVDEDKTEVYMDDVFSGLPSVSLEFVKSYIEEVIDFFKSFKIFTHESSIMYVIDDKFDQYVQLIDHILLKYLFDKAEIIKIEDFISNSKVNITEKERTDLIDKVWFSMDWWIRKNYSEYYENNRNALEENTRHEFIYYCPQCGTKLNSNDAVCPQCVTENKVPIIFDNYASFNRAIREWIDRRTTFEVYDEMFNPENHYIKELEIYAVDAILHMLVDMYEYDQININDTIGKMSVTKYLTEYINEWITDIAYVFLKLELHDGEIHCSKYFCPHCGKEIEYNTITCPYCGKTILEPDSKYHYISHIKDTLSKSTRLNLNYAINFRESINNFNQTMSLYEQPYRLFDNYYAIITQEFPPHEFIDA